MWVWWRKGQEKRNSGFLRFWSRFKSRGCFFFCFNLRFFKFLGLYLRLRLCFCFCFYFCFRFRSWSRLCFFRSCFWFQLWFWFKLYFLGRRCWLWFRSFILFFFVGLGFNLVFFIFDLRFGEENKGYQMLVKMGWSGLGGFGVKE